MTIVIGITREQPRQSISLELIGLKAIWSTIVSWLVCSHSDGILWPRWNWASTPPKDLFAKPLSQFFETRLRQWEVCWIALSLCPLGLCLSFEYKPDVCCLLKGTIKTKWKHKIITTIHLLWMEILFHFVTVAKCLRHTVTCWMGQTRKNRKRVVQPKRPHTHSSLWNAVWQPSYHAESTHELRLGMGN